MKEVSASNITKSQSYYESGTLAPQYGDKSITKVTQANLNMRNMIASVENHFIAVIEN